MKDHSKLIVGLLAGAAVVAAIGVLLSSDKGTEIREEVADYLAELLDTVKSKAKETADGLGDAAQSAVKSTKAAVTSKLNDVSDAIPGH